MIEVDTFLELSSSRSSELKSLISYSQFKKGFVNIHGAQKGNKEFMKTINTNDINKTWHILREFESYGLINTNGENYSLQLKELKNSGFKIVSPHILNNEKVTREMIKKGKSIHEERVVLNPNFHSKYFEELLQITFVLKKVSIIIKSTDHGLVFVNKSGSVLHKTKASSKELNETILRIASGEKEFILAEKFSKLETKANAYADTINKKILPHVLENFPAILAYPNGVDLSLFRIKFTKGICKVENGLEFSISNY